MTSESPDSDSYADWDCEVSPRSDIDAGEQGRGMTGGVPDEKLRAKLSALRQCRDSLPSLGISYNGDRYRITATSGPGDRVLGADRKVNNGLIVPVCQT